MCCRVVDIGKHYNIVVIFLGHETLTADRDRDVASRDRDETETFENLAETRPLDTSRDRDVETETTTLPGVVGQIALVAPLLDYWRGTCPGGPPRVYDCGVMCLVGCMEQVGF